jgi:hypothetical protein
VFRVDPRTTPSWLEKEPAGRQPVRFTHRPTISLFQSEQAMRFGTYGYAWVTLMFFVLSLAGHWLFGWFAYVDEQQLHNGPINVPDYLMEMGRDTLENWQSEFLQLLWQVGGLAMLLYIGSPQSKEGDDRREAKLDAILRQIDPKNGEAIIRRLDVEYLKY